MEDPAPPAPLSPFIWRQRLSSPRVLASLAAGLIAGAAVAGGVWWFRIKPQLENAQRLHDATMDLWTLYDLQMESKRSAGVYLNGLNALLATTKEGPALKARMAGHVDLDTVAIVGDADRFKVELNVLDQDRTLLKIKGPIGKRLWTGAAAAPLPEASASSGDMGAPVTR